MSGLFVKSLNKDSASSCARLTSSRYCDFSLESVSHCLLVLRPKNRPPSNTASDVADWSDNVVNGTSNQAKEAGVAVVVSVHEPLHVIDPAEAAELVEDCEEDKDELDNEPDAEDLDCELDTEDFDDKPAAVVVVSFDMLWLEELVEELERTEACPEELLVADWLLTDVLLAEFVLARLRIDELLLVERLLIADLPEEIVPGELEWEETDDDEPLLESEDVDVDDFWLRAEVLNVVNPWEVLLEITLELLVWPVVADAGTKNTVDLSSMIAEPSKERTSVPIVYARPFEIVTGDEPGSENTKPVALSSSNVTVA